MPQIKTLNGVMLAVALACAACAASARAQAQSKEATASISGRVTCDDEGLAKVSVLLLPSENTSPRASRVLARAATDREGRYRLAGVAAGSYRLAVSAPAYVQQAEDPWRRGKVMNVTAGEHVEDIDFALARGGVITGRVTDAEGRAVIGESVRVTDAESRRPAVMFFTPFRNATDDRGVYRIFGLAPGRYRVSVGEDADGGSMRIGPANNHFRRTFHPAAAEESEARVVEVSAGREATDVDITVGKRVKTYRVAGRIVQAETGQPAPFMRLGYGTVERGGQQLGAWGGGIESDARGEFRVEGVAPGRYGIFAESEQPHDWYSDLAVFEVTDADVSGVELKLRSGASITGVVQLEGVRDPAAAARLLSQVMLYVNPRSRRDEMGAPYWVTTRVGPDGGFRIEGLRPGKVAIGLSGRPSLKGLTLLRVERDGVEVPDGVEVGEAQQVAGVRVVIAYGSGVIRGQVRAEGGALPAGARMQVFALRAAGTNRQFGNRPAEVDARGRFVFENLAAGDYELTLSVRLAAGPFQQVKQSVTVADGVESAVTFTFDPNAPPPARPGKP